MWHHEEAGLCIIYSFSLSFTALFTFLFSIDVVSRPRPAEAETLIVCQETVVLKSEPTEETEDELGNR